MKIIFLSYYSGVVNRGVENYVHNLSNELVNLGYEVIVYQNGPKVRGGRYQSVTVNSKGIVQFTLNVLWQLPTNSDIILPTNGRLQYILIKLWCMLHKKKMIIAGHSGVGFDERLGLYTFPDCFVAFTNYQLKQSKARNPFIHYAKIPNGVTTDLFSRSQVMILDLRKPVIMTSSALIPMKRIHLIIEAVSGTNASLLIVGSGSEEEKLRSLCEVKLKDRFKIINLPYEQMPKAYKSADLFTFATSSWESFGIVLVEAMAAGLGVVATDDPIRREIVGDAGFFVDPRHTSKYTALLQKALGRKWERKATTQAKKFSWSTIAQQYSDLFKKIAK